MGRKVFVSYKYGDTQVKPLRGIVERPTQVRDYVNYLENAFLEIDELYWYAERDDESLAGKTPEYIKDELTDNIFPTSVTLVFISKGMKTSRNERNQWIPWEISYSLKEISRRGRTSQVNGLLLVVLPDQNSSYDYFVKRGECGVNILSFDYIFEILENNFHNKKMKDLSPCEDCASSHFKKSDSFVVWIKWDDFISVENIVDSIEKAGLRGEVSDIYNVTKEI
jgi:hypothetical protein